MIEASHRRSRSVTSSTVPVAGTFRRVQRIQCQGNGNLFTSSLGPGFQRPSFAIAGTSSSRRHPDLTLVDTSALYSHPAASTLPINNRHTTSHPTPMPPRLNTELITRLRRRSSVLSGIVLLCLVGQALFPGVAMTVAALSTENSEVVGCCVVDLSRAAGPSCCCGPTSEKSCGCACGTKKFATTTVRLRNEESSDQSRTIQSEICGCGGNHRPGMITSIEPAVLLPIDEPLFRNADPRFPDSICECSANTQPPPTPPPELCV
jgi:hypothetical protein